MTHNKTPKNPDQTSDQPSSKNEEEKGSSANMSRRGFLSLLKPSKKTDKTPESETSEATEAEAKKKKGFIVLLTKIRDNAIGVLGEGIVPGKEKVENEEAEEIEDIEDVEIEDIEDVEIIDLETEEESELEDEESAVADDEATPPPPAKEKASETPEESADKGFKPLEQHPTLKEIGEEQKAQKKAQEEAAAAEAAIPLSPEEKKKEEVITRRRFLLASLFFLVGGRVLYGLLKKRGRSEFAKQVDKLYEEISLEDLMNIQESPEAVKKLAEKLAKDGYIEDKETGNYLSPKLVKLIGKELMKDEIEELPKECGRYIYNNHGLDIDKPFELRETAAKAFKKAHDKMIKEGHKKGIQLERAFSVNIHQNDLCAARQTDPSLPEAAAPGDSLHEAALAVDVINWPEAADYLKEVGFYCLGNWRLSEKHHFQWGVRGEESLLMETGARLIGWGRAAKKKSKKWLNKGKKLWKKHNPWKKKGKKRKKGKMGRRRKKELESLHKDIDTLENMMDKYR